MQSKFLPKTFSGKVDRTTEECAELILAIAKACRFGWDNHHPDDQPAKNNKIAVMAEMRDVEHAIQTLRKALEKMP